MKKSVLMTSLLTASVISLDAGAIPITFMGSGTELGGAPVTASAIFDISGNQLTITLQNTSPSHNGKDVPGSTLTGLYWDFTGNPLLTPISAKVGDGSFILGTCGTVNCSGITNVGGEFGYEAGVVGGPAGWGISSSGYLTTGLPHDIGNFNNGLAGTDLDKKESLNGINFGIISAASGFNPNGGLEKTPLIQDTVVFILAGVNGLSTEDISNVSFQYGTSLSELNVPGDPVTPPQDLPEPGTLALLGLGLLGFGASRRRKK